MKKLLSLCMAVFAVVTISAVSFSTPTHAASGDPVSIPDAGLKACILATATHANPTYITEAEAAAVTVIGYPYGNCRSQNISNLQGLQYFTGAGIMDLSSNSISNLTPLANLTNLNDLYISNNLTSDLSPISNLDLTRLDLSYTGTCPGLSLAPLAGMSNMTTLYISDCAVSSLSTLANFTNLSRLSLYNTSISDISALSGLTDLLVVDIANNPISNITPLTNLTNAMQISIGGSATANKLLDNSDLAQLSSLTANLKRLYINGSVITDISPLANMTGLQYLTLDSSSISNISPLSSLSQLVSLSVERNQITNISPLAGLTSLTTLRIGNNQITNISPLAGLTNLTSLNMGNNQIADISPLVNLTNITQFYAYGQVVTLPNLIAGQSYSNPLRSINNGFITPTGSTLVYNNSAHSWTFSSNGAKTATWSYASGLSGSSEDFGGSFTQTQVVAPITGSDETPAAPNTGALKLFTSGPAIYIVFGVALLAAIIMVRKSTQARR